MGRVSKSEETVSDNHSDWFRKFRKFSRDATASAGLRGMSSEETRAIAQAGCDLATAGRLEEARIIFEDLVDGNPSDSAVRSALGTVYQKLGRLEDAMAAYNTAVELDPRNPVALGNRGELRLKAGDRDGFTDLARAVDADPHGETSAARRAKSLVKAITLKAVEYVKQQQGGS